MYASADPMSKRLHSMLAIAAVTMRDGFIRGCLMLAIFRIPEKKNPATWRGKRGP